MLWDSTSYNSSAVIYTGNVLFTDYQQKICALHQVTCENKVVMAIMIYYDYITPYTQDTYTWSH